MKRPIPIFLLLSFGCLLAMTGCGPRSTALSRGLAATAWPTASPAAPATMPLPSATAELPRTIPSATPAPAATAPAAPDTLENRDLAVLCPANVAQAQLLASFRPGPQVAIAALEFSADHSQLVFSLAAQGSSSQPVYVWALAKGLPDQILESGAAARPLTALSADSTHLAAASGMALSAWDTSDWLALPGLPALEAPLTALAFTAEGNGLLLGGQDGSLWRWDLASASPAWTAEAHSLEVSALAASHAGQWVASAGMDGVLRLWDAASGRDERTYEDPPPAITRLAFSPDDLQLFSYAKDGQLRSWATSNLRQEGQYQVCSSGLPGCIGPAFSPDRRLMALSDPAAAGPAGVRVWDVQGQALVATLPTAPWMAAAQVSALAFSPDGRLLAVGSQDGQIQLWGLPGGLFGQEETLQVTQAGDGANLRDRPALAGSIRSQLRAGETLSLLEGPQVAGGFDWWRALTADGREGWIVEVPEWYQAPEP